MSMLLTDLSDHPISMKVSGWSSANASADPDSPRLLKVMALDPRFDFMSFLARRRETLSEWLVRTHITSYQELCEQLVTLGAKPVEQSVYDASAPVVIAHVDATSVSQPVTFVETPADSTETFVSKAKRRGRRSVDETTETPAETRDEDVESSRVSVTHD